MGDWLSDLQTALTQIGSNLKDWFSSIWSVFTASAQAIITGYTAIGSALYNGLTEFGNWIQQGLTGLGSKLGEWINSAYEWIHKGLETLGNWLQSGLSALGDFVRGGLDALGGWLKSAFDWIAENIYKFGQWLWNGLCGLGSWVKSGIDWVARQLYNFGNWLWNGLQWIGGVIWNSIKSVSEFFSNIFNVVLDHIKSWWDSVVDYLNTWWSNVVRAFRDKIKKMVVVNVSITGTWKSFERILKSNSLKDVSYGTLGIVASPIVGFLCAEVIDSIIPTPSSTSTFELIPKASVYGKPNVNISFVEPTKPSPPELGDRYSSEFNPEKPELTSPYEPSTAYPTATGGAKTMVVNTTPTQIGALGTKIKSVTIKAPISNTARIWISFTKDMTPDNVFKLYPGEAIDIAVDDLGKLWVRSEEGTQEVNVIWIKV